MAEVEAVETTFGQNENKSDMNLVGKAEGGSKCKGLTGYLILVAVVCFAGSSLQFGYNLSVINAPQIILEEFYKDVYKFKSLLWPIAVSIFAIGGMFGAFIGPHAAEKLGRKYSLLANNFLAIIGGIFLFCTKYAGGTNGSIALLVIGRILVGINAGINTSVAPMYLSEIAPVQLRGSLGTLNQFGIVTGILMGNVLGLSEVLGNAAGWNFLFGITAFVAIFQLVALPFCPESPRYLVVIRKDEFQAATNLQKLRGKEDVSEEINEIKAEAAKESSLEHVTVIGLFRDSYYHKPLLISVVLQLAQQLSGIGGILYYSTKLFVQVGMSPDKGQAATCGVGVLSVLMTAIVIVLVEVKGRRFLMLLGLGGMGLLYIVVTIAFYYVESQDVGWAKILGVTATLASVAVFQLGPGAIPWFIVAELFSQSSISAATSIAGPTNWFGNFIVGILFPIITDSLYPYTFIPFAVLLAFFFTFTLLVVPETKGLTIAQINAKLRKEKVEDPEDSKAFLSDPT